MLDLWLDRSLGIFNLTKSATLQSSNDDQCITWVTLKLMFHFIKINSIDSMHLPVLTPVKGNPLKKDTSTNI